MEELKQERCGTYFSVHSFMTDGLDLSGAELLVYALIYSFSDTADGFHGSQDYISQRTKISERTVRRALISLIGKGLLVKESVKIPDAEKSWNMAVYRTKCPVWADKMSCAGGQNDQNGRTKCPQNQDKMSANNKDYNKHYNKDYNSAHGGARKSPKKEWGFEESNWKNPEWVEAVFEQALARSYAEYEE